MKNIFMNLSSWTVHELRVSWTSSWTFAAFHELVHELIHERFMNFSWTFHELRIIIFFKNSKKKIEEKSGKLMINSIRRNRKKISQNYLYSCEIDICFRLLIVLAWEKSEFWRNIIPARYRSLKTSFIAVKLTFIAVKLTYAFQDLYGKKCTFYANQSSKSCNFFNFWTSDIFFFFFIRKVPLIHCSNQNLKGISFQRDTGP